MHKALLAAVALPLGLGVALAAPRGAGVLSRQDYAARVVPMSGPQRIAYRVPDRMPDVAALLSPADVRLEGYLGARVANNEKNRLLEVDENDLLDAFERRNVTHQDWQGEHV